jgi:hypothetical protein
MSVNSSTMSSTIHVYLTSDDNELLYVLVTDMDFYSLVIGLMVKPLFAFTSDISTHDYLFLVQWYKHHQNSEINQIK